MPPLSEEEIDQAHLSAPSASGPPKVRPIQMGEFLRKWVSKRLHKLNEADISRVMAAMRRLGVGTSGGAEALATLHQLLYEVWRDGDLERPLARIKIDERNCFGSLEWPAIRRASQEELPRHFVVACWKHAAVSAVEQQGVAPAAKDRGAEQGDVDGPLECSLTLGGVATETRRQVHERQRRGLLPWAAESAAAARAADEEFDRRSERAVAWRALTPAQRREADSGGGILPDPLHEVQSGGGLADWWYLDDGDILCHPRLVLPYLQCFDPVNGEVGGERNVIKTEVIYYADEATLEQHSAEWQLEEVRRLASVATAAEPGVTLGVAIGSDVAVQEQAQQKVQVIKAMQERIAITQDVQTEHVLNRDCLGVGRVNHILRVHGDQLLRAGDSLSAFDAAARAELDRLFPGLTPEGHAQASLAASVGGLGWRRASETARPANLGALVSAGPHVQSMAAAAARAGLVRGGQLEARLARKTRQVEQAYLNELDEAERSRAMEFLQKARIAAEETWVRQTRGAPAAGASTLPVADAVYVGEHEDVVAGTGGSEPEEGAEGGGEAGRRRLTVPHVQKELARLQDCTRLRALEAALRQQCNWPQLEALRDLRHKKVSHRWLWHMDSCRGSVLATCDYVADVQRRLGACMLQTEAVCRLCGAPLDPQLVHSECCDTAGATRGHYAVVQSMVGGLKFADPGVCTEPRGLTNTRSRPADIFTTAAVPGRRAALDVCVASPNAAAAAGDAAEAAFKRKLRRYRNEIPQLAAAGISYRPLVWTATGRPHPAVTRTMQYAAELAANRSEQHADSASMLARWRHEVQIAILRRRAAMLRAVLPRPSARAEWLLTGFVQGLPDSAHRAPPIAADGDSGEPTSQEASERDGVAEDGGTANEGDVEVADDDEMRG